MEERTVRELTAIGYESRHVDDLEDTKRKAENARVM